MVVRPNELGRLDACDENILALAQAQIDGALVTLAEAKAVRISADGALARLNDKQFAHLRQRYRAVGWRLRAKKHKTGRMQRADIAAIDLAPRWQPYDPTQTAKLAVLAFVFGVAAWWAVAFDTKPARIALDAPAVHPLQASAYDELMATLEAELLAIQPAAGPATPPPARSSP
ncbi:MAG: hypothetical protein ACFB3T_15755 [Geminicoccaceae bacterium]